MLQECMAEHKDWRKCQQQVQDFRKCMTEYDQSVSKNNPQ